MIKPNKFVPDDLKHSDHIWYINKNIPLAFHCQNFKTCIKELKKSVIGLTVPHSIFIYCFKHAAKKKKSIIKNLNLDWHSVV